MLSRNRVGLIETFIRQGHLQPPADDRASTIPQSRWYALVKPILEFVLTPLLLLVAGPVILLAVLLVKLTSRGPTFYSQKRVGKNGRVYTIYKIRTMVHNCEMHTGPRWATPNDPRITFVGRQLRRTHIDELPQLWNVLCGEMSLVGPRPERPEFVMQFERLVPRYSERLSVRPGLTGLAQVQLPPDSDLSSVRRKLAYDLYYIQRRNLWLDLQILGSTVCYLLSVPFSVPRQLLRVPSGQAIESAYEKTTAAAVPPLPQLQPA